MTLVIILLGAAILVFILDIVAGLIASRVVALALTLYVTVTMRRQKYTLGEDYLERFKIGLETLNASDVWLDIMASIIRKIQNILRRISIIGIMFALVCFSEIEVNAFSRVFVFWLALSAILDFVLTLVTWQKVVVAFVRKIDAESCRDLVRLPRLHFH